MSSHLTKYNSFFDQLFVFILIIYTGSATVFVRSIATWEDPIGLFLPIILSFILAFNHKVKISRNFLFLVIGFTLYNLLLTIKFQAIHPKFFGIYFISFVIAYITYSSLRFHFFLLYERIIYVLCIIALVFWGFHIIAPEALTGLMHQISFSRPGSGNVDSNIILYTINNFSTVEDTNINLGGISLVRNSGFAWEPGAFACFIDLAIFINLIRTKFRLTRNSKIWVFIVALITTFSTTGISIFFLLLVFYIYNQHVRYTVVLIPLTIILGVYITTLPFMAEKLIDVTNYDTEEMIENTILYDRQSTPQRFESLQIDFVDFTNNPILGYGGHMEEQWTAKMGAKVATISGIGKVMAVFGLVGILFFLIHLVKTSKEFAKSFKFKGWIFPFTMIIMIAISYSLIFLPLLMCFWLMNSSYLSNKQKLEHLINKLKIIRLKSEIHQGT